MSPAQSGTSFQAEHRSQVPLRSVRLQSPASTLLDSCPGMVRPSDSRDCPLTWKVTACPPVPIFRNVAIVAHVGPREDHAGGRDAAGRRVPSRSGQEVEKRVLDSAGSGAREGHHHPREEHRRHRHHGTGRDRRNDQHHRHAGPRRLRRRGRARARDGRRRPAARRRVRGPAPSDPVRAAQGAGRRSCRSSWS